MLFQNPDDLVQQFCDCLIGSAERCILTAIAEFSQTSNHGIDFIVRVT